jgi:hypothetical protein
MPRFGVVVATLAAGAAALASPVPAATPAVGGSAFAARVTNPFYPLLPGMRWVYRGADGAHRMRDVVRVLDRVERVAGVPCAVVDDRVFLDGRLAERTQDWYTQDRDGTVWYYGERTAEVDRRGRVTSREGSWRAGVHGARPGIFMPSHPVAGASFEQEHYAGHAEDRFTIVATHASAAVPFRRFAGGVLVTRETTPLEPGVVDAKWYARGIGQIREASVKGGREHADLVSFRHR